MYCGIIRVLPANEDEETPANTPPDEQLQELPNEISELNLQDELEEVFSRQPVKCSQRYDNDDEESPGIQTVGSTLRRLTESPYNNDDLGLLGDTMTAEEKEDWKLLKDKQRAQESVNKETHIPDQPTLTNDAHDDE